MYKNDNRMHTGLWERVGRIKEGPAIETPKLRLKLHLLQGYSRSQPLKDHAESIKRVSLKNNGNNFLNSNQFTLNLASIEERTSSLGKYENILAKKEQKILDAVEKRHLKRQKRRSVSGTHIHQNYIAQRRHSEQSFTTLEENTMKPTDRYFKQLQNIRMAEKILLVKPSQQCSKKSAGKFYKIQEGFKRNISRLSSSRLRTEVSKQSERKRLNRQKWA